MRKDNIVDNYHGTPVADPYRWMEDSTSPETIAWVDEQNKKTREFLAIPFRDKLIAQLTKAMDFPKYSLPQKVGSRYFYNYNDGLMNQPILYMKEKSASKPVQILDPNQFSTDGTVALTNIGLSRDGKMMTYATSSSGSDWQTVKIRKIDQGEDLPETLDWCRFTNFAWHPDGSGFFYTRYPEPGTVPPEEGSFHSKVFFHKAGTSQKEDKLIYERPDKKELGFSPFISEDGEYLVLIVTHGTERKNRFYYRPINEDTSFIRLLDDHDAMYSPIGNIGRIFYFHCNLAAPRGKIIAIDLDKPQKEEWQEIVPQSEDIIVNARLINNELVIVYSHHAHHQIKIFDVKGKHSHDVELPGLGAVEGPFGKNADDEFFITFSSYLYPGTVLRYDFATKSLEPWFESPTGSFKADDYETKQVFYTSKDGTKVPLFLTHKKGLQLAGNNPTLLYGYGGFSISMTPSFSPTILPWLENGGVYAVACLRGGNEYGAEWHRAGMLENKQNVFDDFIAAGEWLIANNYTKKERLAIVGRSNGGLLTAATMTQRPDLFGAVVVWVPVIDMLRYHKFTVGRFWIPEYGNAEANPEHFKFMYAYSPLHNVKEGTLYPPVIIMTADTDDRVVPAHALKFAATLHEKAKKDNPILLRLETKAGHGMGKPTQKVIEEWADMLTFLSKTFNMAES